MTVGEFFEKWLETSKFSESQTFLEKLKTELKSERNWNIFIEQEITRQTITVLRQGIRKEIPKPQAIIGEIEDLASSNRLLTKRK